MLQTSPLGDPIVEILRLAYRRGLALRQEQDKERSAAINFDQVENLIVGEVSSSNQELTDHDASALINKRKSIVQGA